MSTVTLKHEALPDNGDLAHSVKQEQSVHPLFNDEQADITLCSHDQILFRVHSVVLRLSSGWFRTLLSLPQNPASPQPLASHENVQIPEPESVVAGLLMIATGQGPPALDSIAYVEDLLRAGEKYDMPGVVRLAIVSPSLLVAHPIRVYGIACQWGWVMEAMLASRYTIKHDLLSAEAATDLATVDSPHLVKLLALHRRRRDMLREGLEDLAMFIANVNPGICRNCIKEVVPFSWARLKLAWLHTAETSPADITPEALLYNCELFEVLDAKCSHCKWFLYAAGGTIGNLRTVLDSLPTAVEL